MTYLHSLDHETHLVNFWKENADICIFVEKILWIFKVKSRNFSKIQEITAFEKTKKS